MKKLLFAICLLALVVSCALESVFSLPKNETIDQDLLGTWYSVTDESSGDWIGIEKFDDKTYKLVLDKDVTIMFSATIKEHKIMNIVDHTNSQPNMFYGYVLDGDKLTIMEVTDQMNEDDFASQQELINFMETNIDKPDFFINPEVLMRKELGN
jgi:hypothetical protein